MASATSARHATVSALHAPCADWQTESISRDLRASHGRHAGRRACRWLDV